jgi:hypothetical protein
MKSVAKPAHSVTRPQSIASLVRTIRGQPVLLDSDLAAIYGVSTKRLNEQFRRNRDRFPEDFAFRLTPEETEVLRSQKAILNVPAMRSQNATASKRNIRARPYAFTEYGALQAANILNSQRAVQMSRFVIRAFVKMRGTFLSRGDLAKKLAALEKQLTGRLDTHEVAIVQVLQQIMQILNPPPLPPAPSKPRIGFNPQNKT